jgi:hypothetical protein
MKKEKSKCHVIQFSRRAAVQRNLQAFSECLQSQAMLQLRSSVGRIGAHCELTLLATEMYKTHSEKGQFNVFPEQTKTVHIHRRLVERCNESDGSKNHTL